MELNADGEPKVRAENVASALNSDDDFDESDVVFRHHRSSRYLLEDEGDGSEADLLGSTPPRSRIRNKEMRKNFKDSELFVQRSSPRTKRNSDIPKTDTATCPIADRMRKRASLKLFRSRERDWKQDMGQRDQRSDSLPSPSSGIAPEPAVPTLVESCNRFMCLTSKLKSKNSEMPPPEDELVERRGRSEEEPPASRVSFHKTFSMLINMGNMEKGCRRTISREEQVWQNELKDLIWLELQATLAGRTLAQQDAFLCAQRDDVPTILNNIMEYKFVSSEACRSRSQRQRTVDGSREDLGSDQEAGEDTGKEKKDYEDDHIGCLTFDCRECTEAIGKAMKEIGALLDSFYNAVALYPSSLAMTVEHPLVATEPFNNRLKAMCLWYNTALHMRIKMLAVRRIMRTLRRRPQPLRKSSSTTESRPCQVQFNLSDNPSDSNISDSSSHSDSSKERTHNDQQSAAVEETGVDSGGPPMNGDVKLCNEVKDVGDEVDCGVVRSEISDPPTPEIIISDKYASTESGYTSGSREQERERERGGGGAFRSLAAHAFSLGTLGDMTQLRLLGRCSVSPYREYHYEMLKTQGVRRCMTFVNKLRQNVLHKVHVTLEKSDSPYIERCQEEDASRMFDNTKVVFGEPPKDEDIERTIELRRYGCWSEESLSMRLPSYRNHFLVLSTVCMEAVHDYLSLRLESRPERPSSLTVKQLIHELKEGLDISTEMRHDFVRNVEVALTGVVVTTAVRRELLLILRTYDDTVNTVLKQYLSYLLTLSSTEHLPRAWLRTEWAFTARLAARLAPPAASLAPAAFADISCNQISRLLTEFKNKFDSLVELEKSVHHTPNRYTAYVMCRAVQEIYAQGREPLLHAAQWARALAAKLHQPRWSPQRQAILNNLMSMREFTLRHTEMVLERTRVPDEELELTEGLLTRVRELLLQMFKLGFELHKEMYKVVDSPLSEERAQRRSRPISLQPLRHDKDVLVRRKRPDTIMVNDRSPIHKELHRVVKDVSSRVPLASRRSIVNSPPKTMRSKFMRSESINEDNVFDDKLFENFNSFGESQSETIERLLSGEEYHPSEAPECEIDGLIDKDVERQWAAKVGRAVIQFARCWMRFVVERCERGRGLRPRWASQGLEFLMLACDPCNTKHLTEEEFEELKQLMDGCISHVVGSRRVEAALTCRSTRHRLQSPTPGRAAPPIPLTPPEEPPTPPTPQGNEHDSRDSRVNAAIQQLEIARGEKLQSLKAVGRVLERRVDAYEPRLRQLSFAWQRGLKIGAGTFGKVYTVVNTESGQLLAMKELSIGAGDRRALQRAANELQVLEGVIHPHLVRYYGCELHREEMLLFMELCVEGSLEALVATAGALPEGTARRYSRQLVAAVTELHARGIAHRDIKSGNVFLTNGANCLKLGDFGCAVKIRANSTAPGELQGFVGTQAYMAPEVFMRVAGHGRAADVWSLGCVVTEMASGKRPFSDYDSNYQIMFVVGMGGRPEIPSTLSEEGRDFCEKCLSHDSEERPRADVLALHHFLMVKDDCNCTPGYLIT